MLINSKRLLFAAQDLNYRSYYMIINHKPSGIWVGRLLDDRYRACKVDLKFFLKFIPNEISYSFSNFIHRFKSDKSKILDRAMKRIFGVMPESNDNFWKDLV